MSASLVGSEMCIRDSTRSVHSCMGPGRGDSGYHGNGYVRPRCSFIHSLLVGRSRNPRIFSRKVETYETPRD
eukprot:1554623-Alexandrium_andersonii.AAC.1